MNVYMFPDVVERALRREQEIDGGHEDSITPSYRLKRCLLAIVAGAKRSPIYRKEGQERGIYDDAA